MRANDSVCSKYGERLEAKIELELEESKVKRKIPEAKLHVNHELPMQMNV